MNLSPPEFENMPQPVKMSLAAVGGGGLMALVYKYHTDLVAILIIVIGLMFIALLLVLWGRMGKAKASGKATGFGEELKSKLRSTPQGVSDAGDRRKLDDLRRNLQEGMDKLIASGKSLYVLPWYLMVGEPGSGKTKAIGAAGVSLPGFQDPLQGAGGTVKPAR